MSDMFDDDELVDLHPGETNRKYTPVGYPTVQSIAYDLQMLANIVENEFPHGSDEEQFAQKVLDNLRIMNWERSK